MYPIMGYVWTSAALLVSVDLADGCCLVSPSLWTWLRWGPCTKCRVRTCTCAIQDASQSVPLPVGISSLAQVVYPA
ncbi:hypothetical protein B0I35DRAFT_126383 [Stachybotrys elegans]|uniref:Secreted protein n=1 Tax=Stachybotrys elegans TaxID=80388 RepID=A0A8K0WUZ4_9HYPO|nr:hypothetical protein B0I35DRAFT_126383 [Stachybotrys elegans]